MPNCLWYCCSCDSGGPYIVSLYALCSSCEHRRCSKCSTETVEDGDSGSDAGDSQSECSDIAYRNCPSSKPIYSAPMSNFSILDAPPSIITPTGVRNLTSLPKGTPTYSIPLTATNLSSFDDAPTGQGLAPYNSLSTNTRGTVEYVWYCSECGDGGHSCKFVTSCTNCYHKRDTCCKVISTVRK